MSQQDYIIKAGEIQTRETKQGTEIYSFNHERKKLLHIGTVAGACYEKGNVSILWSPEPSVCLLPAELAAALEAGASFLRCIPSSKKATHSISLADFQAHATSYHNAFYGVQLRTPLTAFASISTTARRNSITDNPKPTRQAELLPRQMSLFG